MDITYQWLVERLEAYPQRDGFTDVVFSVFWRVNASDAKRHKATISGVQPINLDGSGDFTPYDKLTPEQVIGWAQGAMGPQGVADVQNYLAGQISNQMKPPVASPALPWNK
jgi:hypothetical protein